MSRSTNGSMIASAPRRAVLLGLASAAAAPAMGAEQCATATSDYERRAIALINDWASALIAKDADKAASYLDENCQYRDDPFQTTPKQGRTQALADIKILLRGLKSMKIETAYAIGSATEVLVLVRRVDTFALNGKEISTPLGAYFRVREGKILEWLDTPLVAMPPPPK